MGLKVYGSNQEHSLGHFQVGSYRYGSLIGGLHIPYRSLIEALYTRNSPPYG